MLLEDADDFVRSVQRKLTKHRITEADWKLWEATKKDLKQLSTASTAGSWRPLPRFVLHQGAKWRAIDDGRASRANSGAGFTAQVHTATVDGIVANVRTFYRRVLQHFGTELPDDLAMEGGVDDETAAFRYRPTRDDDAPFLIVAVFNPVLRRVQFGEMNGHPFGVGAAVLNYNRQPEVVIHTMRTVLGVCAHHFYDDALILGLNVEKGSAQQSYRALQDLLHTKLDRGKRQLMSQVFVYIGVQISFAELFQCGRIALAPKPGRVEAIQNDIARYRRADRLRPREAAGNCIWVLPIPLSMRLHRSRPYILG